MIQIQAIPAFESNYIWLLHNQRHAVVIDPGDATPVVAALQAQNLTLTDILVTHHHADHIGGVDALIKLFSPNVYAPEYERFAFAHIALGEGGTVRLASLDLELSIWWLPGHTLGHIVYFDKKHLFCGDVMFGAGCGYLFEGTHAQMLQSLNRLKQLDPDTKVYCTHEYTMKNISFALTLESNNHDLLLRQKTVSLIRQKHLPSLPSTIDMELKTNPFLRCRLPEIVKNSRAEHQDELSVFTAVRTLRNHY